MQVGAQGDISRQVVRVYRGWGYTIATMYAWATPGTSISWQYNLGRRKKVQKGKKSLLKLAIFAFQLRRGFPRSTHYTGHADTRYILLVYNLQFNVSLKLKKGADYPLNCAEKMPEATKGLQKRFLSGQGFP